MSANRGLEIRDWRLEIDSAEPQSPISNLQSRLLALYDALYAHFGHEPHWWPIVSDTPQFEILIGAVLVQQTRWETVEAAVIRLRDAELLTPAALAAADTSRLAALIRPCAFHAQKAPGLQAICRHIVEHHDGDVAALLAQERAPLRAELLALPRIGPETADTIMLYAGDHPAFIVDAYTRRLFARLDLLPGFDFARARYDAIQSLIEGALADGPGPWAHDDQRLLYGGSSVSAVSALAPPHPADTEEPPYICDSSLIDRRQTDIEIENSKLGLRHFLWDLHALIVEECIHHCLATNPRQDRPGAKRTFVDPRKCATHCLDCHGCPLRAMCATYHASTRTNANADHADRGG